MGKDISNLLSEWPTGSGSNVRRIMGDDGREKIQVRICLDSFNGLLQFECDGRPDGQRPHGSEFYLDYLEEKRRELVESGARPDEYRLSRAQCKRLFDEGTMVYHRYVVLLQMGDFARVTRDTSRNMRLFRFVHQHASNEADKNNLECWWSYLLRIHFTAIAMQQLAASRLDAAFEAITTCRRRLEDLAPQDSDVFKTEMKRSLEALGQIEHEIRSRMPVSEIEKLERQKQAAIREQRYEEAARLRDRIKALKTQPPDAPAGAP